jgi:hypothetical protein
MTETRSSDHIAWLDQATKARDAAFRLAHDRFMKDFEVAAQLVGCRDPNTLALEMEYADKLTAEYLTESNKLFHLMSKFAQDGLLETWRCSRGSDVPIARAQS